MTPNAEKLNQRMQSSLAAQNQAIKDQQNVTMDSIRQQLALMNLPPDQEAAYIKQYQDAFDLQDQQLAQQAQQISDSGTGRMRTIWVRSLPTALSVSPQSSISPFEKFLHTKKINFEFRTS